VSDHPRRVDPDQLLSDDGDPPSKRALLAAALRLFVQDGYDATSIRAIATAAGYTNPALFKFFDSKDELGAFLFERCYREFMGRLQPHLSDDGEPELVLRRWVGAYLDILEAHLAAVLYVHEQMARFWPEVGHRFQQRDPFTLLLGWLDRARRSGRVSTATPPRLQATVLVGYFHQLARMLQLGLVNGRRRAELQDASCRLLLGALRA
jgi:TetR/AcrR family transcriptional regulator, repressor of fatR-cypB operon